MDRKVVDPYLFVVRVKDDHVPKIHVPLLPDIGYSVVVAVDVLQPGNVASPRHVFVANPKRPIVDPENLDVQQRMARVELVLKRV